MDSIFDFFSYKVKATHYFYNEGLRDVYQKPYHSMTDFDLHGENLCISVLNYNRVELTIKLIQSIELFFDDYKGDILIIDNNSEKDQIMRLEEFVSTSSLNIILKKLPENNGVGRARNIAANHTAKDWIMFIDSDMYFIKNPLPQIKETINTLGVKFLNLPIIDYDRESVFALGGALFMSPSNDGLIAGGGSVFNINKGISYKEIELNTPFLSDFLFGGSAVVNRAEFLNNGGFDKNMFIGFEDVDYSFHLYKKGIKVGNIPLFSVIHDHKPSANAADLKAEKERYSNKIIEASGKAFYEKNKINIYDQNTRDWLATKQVDINKVKNRFELNKRHKITLVVDKRNWAFHNIANNIVKHLSDKFEFELIFSEDYNDDNWMDLYYDIYKTNSDIVYCFWRPTMFFFFASDVATAIEYKHKVPKEVLQKYFNNTVMLTSIYDHLYLDDENVKEHLPIFETFIDGYSTSSALLNNIYHEIYPDPFIVIQDGVDLNKFTCNKKIEEIGQKNNEKLVVGWVGNSLWGTNEDGVDFKGFNTIIKPVIEELVKDGFDIELQYADSAEPKTKIPHDAMNDFYKGIDVYLCLSEIEGTPNTILESMACGVAVITTNVGIVNEVFGQKQKQFVLKERTKNALKEKLIALYTNRAIVKELVTENLIRIKNWSWESKCELFELFFSSHLIKGPKVKFELVESQSLVNEPVNGSDSTHAPEMEHKLRRLNHQMIQLDSDNKAIKDKLYEVQDWYNKEYEALPLWYKRFGHIIKIATGKRKLFKEKSK